MMDNAAINGLLSLGILVATGIVLSIIMKRATRDPGGEEGDTEEKNEYGSISVRWSLKDEDDKRNR